MSIIVDINYGRRKLTSEKLMLHNFAVASAVHGNSIFKFSEYVKITTSISYSIRSIDLILTR